MGPPPGEGKEGEKRTGGGGGGVLVWQGVKVRARQREREGGSKRYRGTSLIRNSHLPLGLPEAPGHIPTVGSSS
jgi:hypothetical protein